MLTRKTPLEAIGARLALPSVLSLVLLLFLLPSASATLSCVVDNAPFLTLTTKPSAFCAMDAPGIDCVTFYADPNDSTNVWGFMPERDLLGRGATFHSDTSSIVVVFSTDRVFANVPVTATILCNNEVFVYNMTPQFVDLETPARPFLYLGGNAGALILLFLALLCFILGILFLYRLARK